MTTNYLIASILAITLGTSGACGSDDACHGDDDHCTATVDGNPGDASAEQVITETRTLVAGQYLEGTFDAGAGDTLRFVLAASAPDLDWNIHGHVNGATQIVDEAFGQTAVDHTFAPTSTAAWSVLLRNSGDATINVDITLTINGGAWTTWETE